LIDCIKFFYTWQQRQSLRLCVTYFLYCIAFKMMVLISSLNMVSLTGRKMGTL